jgi:YVTN family beta-propeller protein
MLHEETPSQLFSRGVNVGLERLTFIDLPAHEGDGGFDHAGVHGATGHCYVAHTANDAVDVIDLTAARYVGSITGLAAVAGALVDDASGLVFTSNRGENTVGIIEVGSTPVVTKVEVGLRPNGLAYDPGRRRLLVAHVGDPAIAGSRTVSIVDVESRRRVLDVPVPGRTRWTVFDPQADAFHVNIADPAQIVVVDAGNPVALRRHVDVPHAGPHGLDIDVAQRRIICACDAGVLVALHADTGAVLHTAPLSGAPDVIFLNRALRRVYVAIADPGVIDVFDSSSFKRLETVTTEPGAHTIAFDERRNMVCAFLPESHRAALYVDRASAGG